MYKRPSLFTDIRGHLDALVSGIKNNVFGALIAYLAKKGIEAKQVGSTLVANADPSSMGNSGYSEERLIDLKPLFARSSKVKMTNGPDRHWYMIIPVRASYDKMPSSWQQEADSIPDIAPGKNTSTQYMSYLYSKNTGSLDSPTYSMFGGNLSRVKSLRGSNSSNNSGFIAFRTVSAKSPSSSWLVRRKFNTGGSGVLSELSGIISKVIRGD